MTLKKIMTALIGATALSAMVFVSADDALAGGGSNAKKAKARHARMHRAKKHRRAHARQHRKAARTAHAKRRATHKRRHAKARKARSRR